MRSADNWSIAAGSRRQRPRPRTGRDARGRPQRSRARPVPADFARSIRLGPGAPGPRSSRGPNAAVVSDRTSPRLSHICRQALAVRSQCASAHCELIDRDEGPRFALGRVLRSASFDTIVTTLALRAGKMRPCCAPLANLQHTRETMESGMRFPSQGSRGGRFALERTVVAELSPLGATSLRASHRDVFARLRD